METKSGVKLKGCFITECPNCGWTLQEHKTKGLHCPFCGWKQI